MLVPSGAIMIKVITGFMLAVFILTTLQPAVAQQPEKVPRIGYLSLAAKVSPKDEAFGGATDDISIHHQTENGQTDRREDFPIGAVSGG